MAEPLIGVDIGGEQKYREVRHAMLPPDDLYQRTDLDEAQIGALAYLLTVSDTYNMPVIRNICLGFMRLSVSKDRENFKGFVEAFKNVWRKPEFDEREDAMMNEMREERR